MSDHDYNEEKQDKVSNIIDVTLVMTSAFAYLISSSYPGISKFMTDGIGFIFMVLVIPHFFMMWNEKKILNYHFMKYIIETSYHKFSFIVRNVIIYAIYYYIWSFNNNAVYLTGLSLVMAFDAIVLLNIISASRIATLKERFNKLPKPEPTDTE